MGGGRIENNKFTRHVAMEVQDLHALGEIRRILGQRGRGGQTAASWSEAKTKKMLARFDTSGKVEGYGVLQS